MPAPDRPSIMQNLGGVGLRSDETKGNQQNGAHSKIHTILFLLLDMPNIRLRLPHRVLTSQPVFVLCELSLAVHEHKNSLCIVTTMTLDARVRGMCRMRGLQVGGGVCEVSVLSCTLRASLWVPPPALLLFFLPSKKETKKPPRLWCRIPVDV